MSILGLAVLMMALSLGGCADEDGDQDGHVDPWLPVGEYPAKNPLPGVKVVLMDPVTNMPVAGPVISDANGVCVFSGLGDGPYQVVAFGGATHFVVDVQPFRWDLVGWPKDGARLALTGPDKTPPAPVGPQVMMEAYLQEAGLPRIAGQVIDAQSGEPLDQVFVSTSPFPGGYAGHTTYKDDVTGTDGAFAVSEILFGQDPQSGNLVQLQPLLLQRAGYLPAAWTYDPPNGSDDTDISGVVIPLEPLGSGATGSLTGHLSLRGEPSAGVLVTAGRLGPDKSSVGLPGLAAITDQSGVFLLENVPPGVYLIEAGYLPRDGVVYPNQPGNVGREVLAGQTTDAGDLILLQEIQLYTPASAGTYASTAVIFPMTWSEVPGAVNYAVFVDGQGLAETAANRLDAVADFTLAAGGHVWSVTAYDGQGNLVGVPQRLTRFFLNTPPD